MKQRLLIILLTLLTTTTAGAEDINLVASPAEGGTIAFAPDQNHNHRSLTRGQECCAECCARKLIIFQPFWQTGYSL